MFHKLSELKTYVFVQLEFHGISDTLCVWTSGQLIIIIKSLILIINIRLGGEYFVYHGKEESCAVQPLKLAVFRTSQVPRESDVARSSSVTALLSGAGCVDLRPVPEQACVCLALLLRASLFDVSAI